MIQVADNFNYRGKKPNFDRDSFDTFQERPANIINKGFQYFDTTINKPIYWDGSKWIDATGATV